jgi:chitinase
MTQLSRQLHSSASALTHGAASAAAAAAAAPPGYINVVIISFVKPECTYTKGSLSFAGTGLDFSSSGPVVKAAIAALKAATNNNTKVLLAVGGATYTNFAQMNTQCIADLVDDFGFDGVDIDFEVGAGHCCKDVITREVIRQATK